MDVLLGSPRRQHGGQQPLESDQVPPWQGTRDAAHTVGSGAGDKDKEVQKLAASPPLPAVTTICLQTRAD